MPKAAQVSPLHLVSVPLNKLRPAQVTVGLAEVAAKRNSGSGRIPTMPRGGAWTMQRSRRGFPGCRTTPTAAWPDFVRRGGYAEDATACAEFLWADILRLHFTLRLSAHSLEDAVEEGIAPAESDSASYLPAGPGGRLPGVEPRSDRAGETGRSSYSRHSYDPRIGDNRRTGALG